MGLLIMFFFPPWRFNPNVGWYFVGQDSKTMVPECDFRTPIILELSVSFWESEISVGFQGPSSGKAVSSPCSCHRKQPSTLDVEPPDELHENPRISVAFCHALPWQRKVCAKACELWVAANGFGWCTFWNLYRVLQIWFVKAP